MTQSLPSPPSVDTIRRVLAEFQLTVDERQVSQIQQYMKMLLAWNDKVNLTAIRDPLEILYRHFCESMYAVSAVPIKNGRLADIGSGGGFPGLPIQIMVPDAEIFLVESNVKKATFLAEVGRELELSRCRVIVSRYEELGEELTPLDYVCSRAVGEFVAFLSWAHSPHDPSTHGCPVGWGTGLRRATKDRGMDVARTHFGAAFTVAASTSR